MTQEWRRKYSRISCAKRIPVLIKYQNENKMFESWGVIIDISLGGLRFESRTKLQKDQTVYLTFSLAPCFYFGVTQCMILRVTESGIYNTYGVKFESLLIQKHLEEALEYFASL